MKNKKTAKPINRNRIRKINSSFSWIDHRFVNLGFIDSLSACEIYLYFWLVAVGDRFGVSFYSIEKTCSKLKVSADRLLEARKGLVEKNLIAYQDGVYQVLAL